jgi:uncharacterized protein (DUF433 family)
MAKKLNRITIQPNVCQGQATIRGMRITVAFVLKLMASGMKDEEILQAYPELEKADLRQAIEYAAWLASESHQPASQANRELAGDLNWKRACARTKF